MPLTVKAMNVTRNTLPYLAAARVSGPDAAAFLHAQLSADVAALARGEATFACYCSPRGQVFGLLLVCRRDEDFLLAGAAELLPDMIRRLRLFVLRARVELALDEDLSVAGAEAEDTQGTWATGSGLRYRLEDRRQGRRAASATESEPWKARELQHGVTWLGPATSERFIPQMLGFDRLGAVSFSKGCYPGQEIVARARYLGKVKRRPLRLLLDASGGVPPTGADGLAPGAAVTLQAGAERLDATLIDYAKLDTGQALLFVVAPAAEDSVQSVEIAGRAYGCATI